jgi:hypothetical protein
MSAKYTSLTEAIADFKHPSVPTPGLFPLGTYLHRLSNWDPDQDYSNCRDMIVDLCNWFLSRLQSPWLANERANAYEFNTTWQLPCLKAQTRNCLHRSLILGMVDVPPDVQALVRSDLPVRRQILLHQVPGEPSNPCLRVLDALRLLRFEGLKYHSHYIVSHPITQVKTFGLRLKAFHTPQKAIPAVFLGTRPPRSAEPSKGQVKEAAYWLRMFAHSVGVSFVGTPGAEEWHFVVEFEEEDIEKP